MNSKTVAILGAGPSGLVAAQAAILSDWDVHLYTRGSGHGTAPVKSRLFGCQYLHAPIRGVPAAEALVTYKLEGTIEGYRRKVYGDKAEVFVSPEKLDEVQLAWNIRDAYDALWDSHIKMGNSRVFVRNLNPTLLYVMEHQYQAIVSTVPAPAICKVPGFHKFSSQHVYASGDAPDLGVYAPVRVEKNSVVCSGDASENWYRAANVFDYATVEWPLKAAGIGKNAVLVRKPISTDCSCFPSILRAGRYAEWQKGVLVHETFDKVKEFLNARHGA